MIRINISYTEDAEAALILKLLQPLLSRFRVKKSAGTAPYKHIYIMPKNGRKA